MHDYMYGKDPATGLYYRTWQDWILGVYGDAGLPDGHWYSRMCRDFGGEPADPEERLEWRRAASGHGDNEALRRLTCELKALKETIGATEDAKPPAALSDEELNAIISAEEQSPALR